MQFFDVNDGFIHKRDTLGEGELALAPTLTAKQKGEVKSNDVVNTEQNLQISSPVKNCKASQELHATNPNEVVKLPMDNIYFSPTLGATNINRDMQEGKISPSDLSQKFLEVFS